MPQRFIVSWSGQNATDVAVGATLMWPIGGLVHLVALAAFVGLFWWNVRRGRAAAST